MSHISFFPESRTINWYGTVTVSLLRMHILSSIRNIILQLFPMIYVNNELFSLSLSVYFQWIVRYSLFSIIKLSDKKRRQQQQRRQVAFHRNKTKKVINNSIGIISKRKRHQLFYRSRVNTITLIAAHTHEPGGNIISFTCTNRARKFRLLLFCLFGFFCSLCVLPNAICWFVAINTVGEQ